MSNTIIIHSRLYKVDGVCYADEVVISQAEFDELADHYHTLVDALARPWKEKDLVPEIEEVIETPKTTGRKGKARRYDVSHRPPPKRIY